MPPHREFAKTGEEIKRLGCFQCGGPHFKKDGRTGWICKNKPSKAMQAESKKAKDLKDDAVKRPARAWNACCNVSVEPEVSEIKALRQSVESLTRKMEAYEQGIKKFVDTHEQRIQELEKQIKELTRNFAKAQEKAQEKEQHPPCGQDHVEKSSQLQSRLDILSERVHSVEANNKEVHSVQTELKNSIEGVASKCDSINLQIGRADAQIESRLQDFRTVANKLYASTTDFRGLYECVDAHGANKPNRDEVRRMMQTRMSSMEELMKINLSNLEDRIRSGSYGHEYARPDHGHHGHHRRR